MNSIYYTTYLVLLIFIALVAIGGYESTMRLIHYVDLQLRMMIINVRLYFMRRKLDRQMRLFHKKYGDNNVRHKKLS